MPMPTSPRVPAAPGTRRVRHRLSVLLADDHADTLDGYRIYFETVGLEVSTATDGAAAVLAAREILPDVIVLDVRMPGMNGFEVLRALRSDKATCRIPIILLTGAPVDGQPRSGAADEAVMKPCLPADLLSVVRRHGGRA